MTLNKHQCLFRVVFGVIFCLLNLKVTKVQSNFAAPEPISRQSSTVAKSALKACILVRPRFRGSTRWKKRERRKGWSSCALTQWEIQLHGPRKKIENEK